MKLVLVLADWSCWCQMGLSVYSVVWVAVSPKTTSPTRLYYSLLHAIKMQACRYFITCRGQGNTSEWSDRWFSHLQSWCQQMLRQTSKAFNLSCQMPNFHSNSVYKSYLYTDAFTQKMWYSEKSEHLVTDRNYHCMWQWTILCEWFNT